MTKPYRPSNGTEGSWFRSVFCATCEHDRHWREREKRPCLILNATMAHFVDDPEYPHQWVRGSDGPTCTAYVSEEEARKLRKAKRKLRKDSRQGILFGGNHE